MTETGWRRVALPGPGALGDQDYLLMHQLELVRSTANAIEHERMKERQREGRTRAWRDRRAAASRGGR
jgi:hypothetical protein